MGKATGKAKYPETVYSVYIQDIFSIYSVYIQYIFSIYSVYSISHPNQESDSFCDGLKDVETTHSLW